MSDYQVIARKFRPQCFKDVVGQDAIILTLKNAIKFNRLAQAYLFCGSRGTGKTTLARLLAKALNCQQLSEEYEPCNQCISCREIITGSSLDVLEIDGASHRGIEDIRQINENVGYATAAGRYKIYIIDEVHMLTKEAFNALLKTLEEPPLKVKFFFATTEPHKVLPTIVSRCQRFNLNRIPLSQILTKLRYIAHQLKIDVEEDALCILAQRAEGGLRDAESLFDQIYAFEQGRITIDSVTRILGLMPKSIYLEIDRAGKEGYFSKAFEIAQHVFNEGKDLTYFIEGLIDHLRQILIFKLAGRQSSLLSLTELEKDLYEKSSHFYSQEQCVDLIEYLLQAQNQLRTTSFSKIFLETILLHVMRSHFRLPIEQLVKRLTELEQLINEKSENASPILPEQTKELRVPSSVKSTSSPPKIIVSTQNVEKTPLSETGKGSPPNLFENFVSIDPTPTPADLGKSSPAVKPAISVSQPKISQKPMDIPTSFSENDKKPPRHQYDTLFHFAAVELEGKLQKNL